MWRILRWFLIVVSVCWVYTAKPSEAQTSVSPPAWNWKMTGTTLQILGVISSQKDQVLGKLSLPVVPGQVLRW